MGILHGGVTAYQAATLSFADSYLSRQPKVLSVSFDTSFYAPKTDLLEVVEANQSAQLLDARPSAWHEGKKWHPASLTPGTLEFSKILDHSQFFVTQDSSRLKAMGEIEALLDASNVQPNNISFCEAGWWSAGN